MSENAAEPTDSVSILMLDKVLIGPAKRYVRGVELFNLNLIRDLAALGHAVSVLAHPDWLPALRELAPPGNIDLVAIPPGPVSLTPYRLGIGARRYSLLLLGNVANRLIPALLLLRMRRTAKRCVLIAHREPSRRCLQAQKLWPSTIIAVNRRIAGHFEHAGFKDTSVYYGVTDASNYAPVSGGQTNGLVHFCVAGHLDNAWKGSDTAVEAFRMLPETIRKNCRLHLASFQRKPDFGDDSIVAYEWMDHTAMPDFFRRMDVMIVPSRDEQVMRETFSQVMVQGMLSGLPMLVNRLPILEEKIDAGGGLVFGNARELCDGIIRLAGDPDLRHQLGRDARKTALARYVWDTRTFFERYVRPKLSS